jgi:electron transfer flavoprotein beta subunit
VTGRVDGPDRATEAIRKALSMGADAAVHLSDEALAGLGRGRHGAGVGRCDRHRRGRGPGARGQRGVGRAVGRGAGDGRRGAGLPALTHAREVTVEGGTVTVRRETDDGVVMLTAELPAVVSVGEKINEPRYPSFKGIMAAKKKKVTTLSLADAGVDAAQVGAAGALTSVVEATPKPPKSAGEKVVDDGAGGAKVAAFLVAQKLI